MGDTFILCVYVQVAYIVAGSYLSCCLLGSSVSLRSHRRASQHLVWPVWSSTASAKRRYLTSQTSCSSSRMWNTGRSACCGSVHSVLQFIFKQKKNIKYNNKKNSYLKVLKTRETHLFLTLKYYSKI